MSLPKKALLAITSYNQVFYSDGARTGLFYTEALHPYMALVESGFEVDLASETGTFGLDEHSTEKMFLTDEDEKILHDSSHPFNVKLNSQLKKASTLDPKSYGLFFASAGHATLYDYPDARGLQSIAEDIYERGGVVSAVCHGPAILPGIKDLSTGKSVAEGKVVTGFTDLGEEQMNIMAKIEGDNLKTVEKWMKIINAKYIAPPEPFACFSKIDGRVVTGANPASAKLTAENAIKVFECQ
ncbi:class I glutamine amidotransferase-like protein [Phycomyces nitens]|nr:class I glutamine amidotransferase-like protein [Phycomyces nitens]